MKFTCTECGAVFPDNYQRRCPVCESNSIIPEGFNDIDSDEEKIWDCWDDEEEYLD